MCGKKVRERHFRSICNTVGFSKCLLEDIFVPLTSNAPDVFMYEQMEPHMREVCLE